LNRSLQRHLPVHRGCGSCSANDHP
jgi:hypothetical protein